MKRFLAVLVAALVIALALWVALRVQQANRQMQVSELLPEKTLLLAHVPDFKKTREQWRASDLYALWHEPAVEAWLQKPLEALAKRRGGSRPYLEEFLQLEPTDGFLGLTSIANNAPKFVGGFHFGQAEAKTRRFIEDREAPLLAKSGSVRREKIIYQDHEIETVNAGRFGLATVYDRNWFFASNDLATLEAILDRADRRTPKATADSLHENAFFAEAVKQLPAGFDGMFFVDPQPFLEKLQPLLTMIGQSAATQQLQRLKKIRSIAGSLGFTHGKMHEAVFVATPLRDPQEKLTRPSLPRASANTFFYSASLTHWPENWQLSGGSARPGLPPFLQQMATALGRAGLTQGDISAALGDELELLGEWPQDAHWPIVSARIPVRDRARARRIADALTSVGVAGLSWTRSDRDGVSYYTTAGLVGFIPVTPTLAISDKMLIVGTESAAVDAAIAQTIPPAGELRKSEGFQAAEKALPAGETSFNYIDSRLLFERADAALRPLLLLSATLYPAWGTKLDAAKLPPADAIAKHLSPIVMTQRYSGAGYLSESIGPITFNEAAVGLMGAITGAYIYGQRGLGDLYRQKQPATTPAPAPTPSPAGP